MTKGSDGVERAGLMVERRHCCCFRADFSLSPSFFSLSVSVSVSLRPKPKSSVYEVIRCKQLEKYLRLINLRSFEALHTWPGTAHVLKPWSLLFHTIFTQRLLRNTAFTGTQLHKNDVIKTELCQASRLCGIAQLLSLAFPLRRLAIPRLADVSVTFMEH